jgi:hypothetical protein
MRRVGGVLRLVALASARGLGAGHHLHGVRRIGRLSRALVSDAQSAAGIYTRRRTAVASRDMNNSFLTLRREGDKSPRSARETEVAAQSERVAATILGCRRGLHPCRPDQRCLSKGQQNIPTFDDIHGFFPPGWEARLYGRQGCPPLRRAALPLCVNSQPWHAKANKSLNP